MSRMKHLLRKLHLGGGGATSDHRPRRRSPPAGGGGGSSAGASRGGCCGAAGGAGGEGLGGAGGGAGMTRFEEEYQVRLAMAISASDPAGRVDPDSVQIRAAERISLGCGGAGASGSGDRSPMEILSLRYWNHNMVNYDEKLMDGFYDVYGVLSDPSLQTKFPSLVNLRSMPPTEDVKYVAISVNRILDPALQQLERKAAAIAVQSKAEHGVAASAELVQKIANLVVNAMGGPVEDADDMNGKWTAKSSELCFSLNSFVLPLGSLEIGLSRHRSLLFKVLADRVNLPCKLVKGIYYTGTDEGAINLVKFDFDSTEYIVDLMGAPGTLIPSEISSSQLQDSNCGQLSSDAIDESVAELCLALEHIGAGYENENVVVEGSSSENSSVLGVAALQLKNRSHTENTLQQIIPCDEGQFNVFNIEGDIRPAQQMKVNDISKFLAPEANDPQFAQKLHTVLLERSASPLPDLFSSLNSDKSHEKGEMNKYTSEDNETSQWLGVAQTNQNLLNGFASENALPYVENTKPLKDVSYQVFPSASYEDVQHSAENVEAVTGNLDLHGHAAYTLSNEDQRIAEDSMANMSGNGLKNSEILVCSGMETINSAVDDIAEYEIPWEDLQIGERIGIGSYGEVYHADWHGTEVAVKKFLDQDFSGVALEQFKYEVKIMSRLRHPNVVLFMGSVTQPPNLSILTEYLPSLYRLLHRPHCQIDETRRLKMALDVAKGMNYLHTSHPTIVHRDLKSPNLLVDKNWVVKVSDFGLSRLKHHTFLSSKSTAGTPEWMAPEVLRNEPSNEKCDVYSFGVILWELATLRMPWGGLNPMQVVGAVGFQNRRLDIPKEVDPLVASIISSCWESDPSKRPSFSQLLSPLKELQRLVAGESY